MDNTSALATEIAKTAAAVRTRLNATRWAVTNALASVVAIDDWIHRIDESSSYAAGSIAFVRNGIAMAVRQTDPIAGRDLKDGGWSVLVSDFFDYTIVPDKERLGWYRVSLIMTDATAADFQIPGPGGVLVGEFDPGTDYHARQVVSHDEQLWLAARTTRDIPGATDAWHEFCAPTAEEHAVIVRDWFAQITATIVRPLWPCGSDAR